MQSYKKIFFLILLSTFINPIVSKSENFYKPYRLFFGFKQQITSFHTDLSTEDRNLRGKNFLKDTTRICFKRRPNHKDYLIGGFNGEVCRKKNDADYGYDAMPEPPTFSYANIEFVPQYITENIGYYIFVSNRKFNFRLVDYPIKDEEVSGILNSTSFAIPIFYKLGDKSLGKDGSFSFRFGLGPSINYINEFYLENENGNIKKELGVLGTSLLFDITFLGIVIKLENSNFDLKIDEDTYFKKDKIEVNTNDRSIGFYYHF